MFSMKQQTGMILEPNRLDLDYYVTIVRTKCQKIYAGKELVINNHNRVVNYSLVVVSSIFSSVPISTSTVKGLVADGEKGVPFFSSSFTSVSVFLMTVSPTAMLVSTVRGSPDLSSLGDKGIFSISAPVASWKDSLGPTPLAVVTYIFSETGGLDLELVPVPVPMIEEVRMTLYLSALPVMVYHPRFHSSRESGDRMAWRTNSRTP